MLLQFDLSGIDWIIGLGVMFAMAYVMWHLTSDDFEDFFIWLTIFNGFVCWGGLLPLWTLILNLLIMSLILYNKMNKKMR